MYRCEKCNKKHDGIFGSGRFCSRSCANSRIRTNETKLKISRTLIETLCNSGYKKRYKRKYKKQIFCKHCKTEIQNKTICNNCRPYIQNKVLFKKLGIIEADLFKANKLAIDKLVDLYYSKKKALLEIYEEYNIKENTVFWFFKKNNIPLRSFSEAVKLAYEVGRAIPTNNPNYKHGFYKTWFGKKVYLRSSYEFRYAKFLDNQKVYYEVESKKFKYYLNDECHTYISDFYIPDWNTIVETKNLYFIERDKEMLKKKQQAVLNEGYEFLLISDLAFCD